MEVTLNDDYDGGEVLHMNAAGVHKTDALPGSATGKGRDNISMFCFIITWLTCNYHHSICILCSTYG